MVEISGEEVMAIARGVLRARFSRVADKELREDLIMEGCVAVLEARNSFEDGRAKFLTYAWKCADNKMLTFFNRERKICGAELFDYNDEVNGEEDIYFLDSWKRINVVDVVLNNVGRVRDNCDRIAKKIANCERQVDIAKDCGVTRQAVNRIMRKIKKNVLDKYTYCDGEIIHKGVEK